MSVAASELCQAYKMGILAKIVNSFKAYVITNMMGGRGSLREDIKGLFGSLGLLFFLLFCVSISVAYTSRNSMPTEFTKTSEKVRKI